jgi:hypothetical protein
MAEPCVLLEIKCMSMVGYFLHLTAFKFYVRQMDVAYYISIGARHVEE